MWIINKTSLETKSGDKNVNVQSGNFDESKVDTLVHKFRLLDDDNEVYFWGLSSNNSSFGPLDDYGQSGFGCTSIQYREDGKWETL